MPTASAKLRKFAEDYFNLDDQKIKDFLERAGFSETVEHCWQRARVPNAFEWNCINFLIEEWDYGGYIED